MKERISDRGLCLTQEEALGLLEIVMLSPGELTLEQRSAIVKLSEFCRECLRDDGAEVHEVTGRVTDRSFIATAFAA